MKGGGGNGLWPPSTMADGSEIKIKTLPSAPLSSSSLCLLCYLGGLSFRDKHLARGGVL